MGSRPDGQGLVRADHLAAHVVDLGDGLYLVAPELHADGVVGIGREHVERIAPHSERAAHELVVVAVVLDVDEVVNHVVAVGGHLPVQEDGHARVVHRAADAVDAAHRRHHDNVATAEQRARRGVAQLLHFLVDAGVLLDERVASGHVGLGLVVVVVADEVHHRVVGEELLQLGRELRGERLVGGHDERRLLHGLDGLGHGERLAAARHAQQRLVAQALVHAAREGLDRLGLVAGHLVGRHHLERRVGQAHLGQLALHWRALDVRKMGAHGSPS